MDMDWTSVKDEIPNKTVIATYKNRMGINRTVIAFYSKKFEIVSHSDDPWFEYNEDDDEYYLTEGWYEVIDNWDEYRSVAIHEGEVTHWMPLPNPPKE